MRKLNCLLATVMLLLWGSGAWADAVSNYKVDFNSAISTSAHDFKVASGWGHLVSSYWDEDEWETLYASYSYKAAGGVDDSGCLLVGPQTGLGSGWSTTGSTTDLLVTPQVTGASSIYVKKFKANGTVKFYTVTKSGTSYTRGSQISVTLPTLSEDEYVKVDIPEQTGAYIGIYGSNVYVDDFEAASVDITLTKALTISKVTLTSGTSADCDENGQFAVAMDVTVTNSGDADLNPGDENYSVSIVNYSKDKAVVATQAIEVPLAVGASTVVSVAGMADYDADKARCRYDAMENLTSTTSYGAWVEAVPYAPALRLVDAKMNALTSGDAASQAFGMVSETVTKTFTIKNTGAAPMDITAITLPDGFVSDLEAPLTVSAHGEQVWNLSFNATEPGIYSGDVVLSIKGLADFKMPVSGTILDPTKFFANFEDGKMPAGVLNEGGTSWRLVYDNRASNLYYLESTSYDPSYKFILPLLNVKEGEKMTLDVARKSANSFVRVYYSDNRKDWTLAKGIVANDMPSDKTSDYPYIYKFKTFVIDNVPAGNKYIAIESGYASVDNIYGFNLVDVAHDMVPGKFDAPLTQMVNKTCEVPAEVTNINAKDVEAGTYTATLYVGDEAVSTAEAVAVASGETASYTFTYTPHVAGTFKTYAVFSFADGYTVTTDTVTVTVEKESATETVTAGVKNATNSMVPLALNYKNSETEVIYTADKLAGMAAGANIGGVVFKGEKSTDNLTTTVTVWIANTTDEACTSADKTLCDVDGMTKVYDGEYTFVKGETNLLSITFPERFEYTGGNIRMVLRSVATTYKQAYFESDGTDAAHCMGRHSDGDYTTASFSAYSLPVANFLVVKDPSTVSGTVIKVDGTPVADATVELANGPVIYTATTDAEGKYTATVFQNDKTYTLTLAADGQTKTKEGVSFADGNVTADFILAGTIHFNAGQKSTLILATAPDATLGSYYALDKVEGNTVTFLKENTPQANVPYVFVPAADCDVAVDEVPETEAGSTTVGEVTFQGNYGVKSLVSDEANTYYGFLASDGTFVQVGSTTGATVNPMHAYLVVPVTGEAKVFSFVFDDNVVTGINGTTAATAGEAGLYDLNGRRVDTLRAAKGLYIKNGKKVIIK